MPEDTEITEEKPVPVGKTIKAWATTAFNWLLRYPLALVAGILVVVVGFMLIQSGVKFNIGGVLKMLFGRAKGQMSVVAASNSVPDKRVDKEGKEIPVGVADENGWTQWEVKKFKTSASPFRDTSVITVETKNGDVEVALPTGIKDTDIATVIEVQPEVYVVRTHVDTAVHAKDLLDKLPAPKVA